MNDKRSKFLLWSLVLDKIKGSMMERKLWNEYFLLLLKTIRQNKRLYDGKKVMEWIFFSFTENQPNFFSYRNKTEINYYEKGWPRERSLWSKNTTKKEDEEKKENWNQIGAINHSALVTPYIQLGLSNSVYKDYFLIPPSQICPPILYILPAKVR